jgi:hypothetical protein
LSDCRRTQCAYFADPNTFLRRVIIMSQCSFAKQRSVLVSAAFALLSLAFAECAATAQGRNSKQRQDARTCESFGASYGTPAYSDCMLAQQHRRDAKQLRSIEESERLSQIAKDGQIMAERARRQRCDRNPDRRECERK